MNLPHQPVDPFAELGIVAFTTTRDAGTFGTAGREPVGEVMGRWWSLVEALQPYGSRLATSRQVHGTTVLTHAGGWTGWLRAPSADGHVSSVRGTALAVTVADCVPVFLAHPSGAVGLLHAGWRGTASRILAVGVHEMVQLGLAAHDLSVHLGPGICGRCYEVGAEVYAQLTGQSVPGPRRVDLRDILAAQARKAGIARISVSEDCTRCDNDRFFSHCAGDAGRALAVIIAPLDVGSP